ncbi:MAG: hypothetical protein ACRCSL_16745 [Microbacterium sp.]
MTIKMSKTTLDGIVARLDEILALSLELEDLIKPTRRAVVREALRWEREYDRVDAARWRDAPDAPDNNLTQQAKKVPEISSSHIDASLAEVESIRFTVRAVRKHIDAHHRNVARSAKEIARYEARYPSKKGPKK